MDAEEERKKDNLEGIEQGMLDEVIASNLGKSEACS